MAESDRDWLEHYDPTASPGSSGDRRRAWQRTSLDGTPPMPRRRCQVPHRLRARARASVCFPLCTAPLPAARSQRQVRPACILACQGSTMRHLRGHRTARATMCRTSPSMKTRDSRVGLLLRCIRHRAQLPSEVTQGHATHPYTRQRDDHDSLLRPCRPTRADDIALSGGRLYGQRKCHESDS